MQDGERLLIPCEGGPGRSRLVLAPPPVELAERGGTYVLVDVGPPHDWRYAWVPDAP